MQRVLFFGENGLVARTIRAALSKGFQEVRPVLGGGAKRLDDTGEIDLRDEPTVVRVLQSTRPDIIINCASLVGSPKCFQKELLAYQHNVQTVNVLMSAVNALPELPRIVHFGTTASYVSQELINESTPPSYFQTAYSLTKLLSEQLILSSSWLRSLVIRPTFLFGDPRYDRSSVISLLIKRHFKRDQTPIKLNLSLGHIKAPTWAEDFGTAVVKLLEINATGTWVIGHALDAKPYNEILEDLLALGIGWTNITWDEDNDPLGDHVPDNRKLRQVLGDYWPKTRLEDGLVKAIELMRS